MKTEYISIDNYCFPDGSNPYAYDSKPKTSVEPAADVISETISSLIGEKRVLVRGIQSGRHAIPKADLVKIIEENGADYQHNGSIANEMYASPFSSDVIFKILEGFHVYKPKSEERPQYPVDIWMIYSADSYENIEYLHPRHKVLAKDKWRRKDDSQSGLFAMVVIN